MKVFSGCITDKGNYREKNQDRAVCHVKRIGQSVLAVACVCDGIGSFEKSEVAAEMMTDGITRWFNGIIDYFFHNQDMAALLEDLEVTIRELNELVYIRRREEGTDIGCTMSLLLIANNSYYVFHVGDSRIYCLHDTFYQITRDEVSMSESNGRVKTRLCNYIGKAPELWVNKLSGSVEEGDLFLLGSDGLFKQLTYRDVSVFAGSIANNRQAGKAAEKLLKCVLERGERDNVSCIIVCVK